MTPASVGSMVAWHSISDSRCNKTDKSCMPTSFTNDRNKHKRKLPFASGEEMFVPS